MPDRKKPTIVLVGPVPPPAGGVEFVTRTLLDSDLTERFEMVHCDISKKRGKEKCGRFDLGNTFAAWRHIRELVRLIREHRPEIVHMPISATKSGFLRDSVMVSVAKAMGVKLIGHIHSGYYERLVRTSRWPLSWWLRRTMNKPDVLIALSFHWKRFLENLAPKARVEVVFNAVDEDFYQQMRTAAPVAKSGARILFVGGLCKAKGVLDLLNAAPKVLEKIPNAHFVLVGGEGFVGEMSTITGTHQELELEQAVEFTGPLFGDAKAAEFLKADLLILPSYVEGLPIVILEGMAAGLPIVSTPVGAIPEVVEEGINGFLVPPGDVEGIADRLVRLCGDSELRAKMGAANLDRVTRLHRCTYVAERFHAIYSELAGEAAKEAVR